MTIELIAYPALIFLAVALAARLIELRSDVLYGPYIHGRKSVPAEMRNQLEAALAAIGPRQDFGHLVFKFATVGLFASALIS
jgi:hypothetical protein